jgi:AraC-like DNA-binding protein
MSNASLLALDWALRGGTCGLVLLLALMLLRDHGRLVSAQLGALFAAGTAAYAICSASAAHGPLGAWAFPLLALSAGNNVVFWLFAAALFDDGFRLRPWHAGLWLVLVIAGLTDCFIGSRPLGIILTLSSFAFALLAVAQALASWRTDLIEGRRRLRLFIVGATSLYIAVVAAAQLAGSPRTAPPEVSLTGAVGLLAIAATVAWTLLRVGDGQALFVDTRVPDESAEPSPPPPATPDQGLVAALGRLMTVERAYRQDGLTIGTLAQRLELPEYRLRRLINQALGYRNFSSFLNHYRIAEAKAALADPTQAAVPILTIALDAGFSSLGPFNRAFKAEAGLTPSEFRRQREADSEIGEPIPVSASPISNPARRISPAS